MRCNNAVMDCYNTITECPLQQCKTSKQTKKKWGKSRWKVQNRRKQEACERFILVPLRWNMEVFALAMLAKTSSLGEEKRDTQPKHPHSLPFKPPQHGLFLPHHKHFISFPTQAICFLNQGRLLFFSHISSQTEIMGLHQQQYRHEIWNKELLSGELDGRYLSLTAQQHLI